MEQYMPTMIMFTITVLFSLLMLAPIKFAFGSNIVRFYWKGFWMFLAFIAIIAGGSQTLMLAGYNVDREATAILAGVIAAFPIFVVVGWIRIVSSIFLKSGKHSEVIS